jgi:3-deoxy-D-manno-octulosonic-acid transferase
MAAAVNLVALLRGAGFSFTAGFTTTNEAGMDWLGRRAPAEAVVSLAPWDAPRHVELAFDRWCPSAVFLIETEIWPSLILEAARRGVPIFCASARIYARDVGRYRLVRSFLAPTFGRLTAVLAQSEIERKRFIDLGAPAERCFVAGNLKDLAPLEADGRGGPGGREAGLVVCGSIHRDEMAGLFTALEAVADPSSRFVVAPRHADGAAAAVREAESRGWPVARRSRDSSAAAGWRVLVLDTMGELAGFYARAQVAVVGGGFADHGGHNPYEPVRLGAPVLFGTHFEHFESEARSLTANAPRSRANDWSELAARLRACFDDDERRDLFERQTRALPDPGAIGDQYLDVLYRRLPQSALAPFRRVLPPAS